MKCRLFILVFILFCTGVFAQTKKSPANLKGAINQYAAQNIKFLNKTGSMGKYKVNGYNSFQKDLDKDGDSDAIVEVTFCEYENCHPTTQSSKLVIFTNQKGFYKPVAIREFTLFGKIDSINGTKIKIAVYDLDEDDPQCCPKIKRFESYEFKGGKLIKFN